MQQPVQIPGGGTELFRALLDREGIQPVTARELGNMRMGEDDLIVIVIGASHSVDGWHDPLTWARLAVQANGAALVASDNGFTLHEAGVQNLQFENRIARFNGNTLIANVQDCYGSLTDCPFAVPVSPDELDNGPKKPGRVWGLFRGLNRLATNQPTYIEELAAYRGEYQYPLARLPKSSRHPFGGRFQEPPLFAVGGDGRDQPGAPGYAFLAVADSSVFINQMLLPGPNNPPNDNLDFTLRTIDYLQGPGKHRKRCAFFENGKLVEKFDGLRGATAKQKPKIPPEAMPSLPRLIGRNQERLVQILDEKADQLQSSDFMHQALVGKTGSEKERTHTAEWAEGAAVLASIAIGFMLLRRTISARQPLDVPPAPNTGAGAAATGPPGVFERRQKELVRRNNLYEPVRNAMREFFDAAGAPPNPGPRLPPLEITDAVRKPGSLRQAIRDMWRIAYGPPVPISAQRWFELEPYFERLRQAHADGKWRFVTDA